MQYYGVKGLGSNMPGCCRVAKIRADDGDIVVEASVHKLVYVT